MRFSLLSFYRPLPSRQTNFRNLGLPYEILELPPVFHPSKANGFFEFSEICVDGVKISNLQNYRRNFVKTSKNSFKLRFYWFSEAASFRKMAFPAFPKMKRKLKTL
jgi:hypothetical protein